MFGRPSQEFEAQVVAQLPRMRRYARTLTGDAAWADDLVQDAAERALSRASSFRPDSNLRAWLLTILRNIYIDQLRGRREIAMDDESAPWRTLEAPHGEVDGLVLRDLQRALYQLPSAQREVLLLVGVEELSYQEASAVLGVPTGTVMSRLSRAREHLRVLLDRDAEQQGTHDTQHDTARHAATLRIVGKEVGNEADKAIGKSGGATR
ncbi:RNA polymerase sigma factor [Paraburkholderia sp. Ac-20340]|uniref:sigma-70 family RNA polymerase sigma factor n=1 Tax=Paraburkholderia sp. Ac-20340 TaxID=2703888 RepID=UPI0019804D30|nr:RNA polymerase sigma factor [Paraburkholderia sp. Ac-20340]